MNAFALSTLPFYRAATLQAAIFLSILLFSAGALLAYRRKVQRALKILTIAIQDLAVGDMASTIDLRGFDQWAALGDNFNQMVGVLREAQSSLEERVKLTWNISRRS